MVRVGGGRLSFSSSRVRFGRSWLISARIVFFGYKEYCSDGVRLDVVGLVPSEVLVEDGRCALLELRTSTVDRIGHLIAPHNSDDFLQLYVFVLWRGVT